MVEILCLFAIGYALSPVYSALIDAIIDKVLGA